MESPSRTPNERAACLSMTPGFHIRHPPPPHLLTDFITPDSQLFQTIHMGRPTIDHDIWQLKIHGLVKTPYTLSLLELKALPATTITSFHECYGSPLQPPIEPCLRVGNVSWTGVRLVHLLQKAGIQPEARYVWSDGLDSGSFGSVTTDRYQKDLPLPKALEAGCLVAYEMNGQPLDLERGGPVRLVVPGWFGTNSTKWLCSLSLQKERSLGPFTTVFYNEQDPHGRQGEMRPVWDVEPNSIIVSPKPDEGLERGTVKVWGWAWSACEIQTVEVSLDGGTSWVSARLKRRKEFEWQRFEIELVLEAGLHTVTARAMALSGEKQPMEGRRNHVHSVTFQVFD